MGYLALSLVILVTIINWLFVIYKSEILNFCKKYAKTLGLLWRFVTVILVLCLLEPVQGLNMIIMQDVEIIDGNVIFELWTLALLLSMVNLISYIFIRTVHK